MKRPVQLGVASLKALAIVVACGAAARAAMPYLPLIGPPPLRFQTVRTPAATVVKFTATPALTATNPMVATRAPASPGPTNSTIAGRPATSGSLIGPDTNQALGDNSSASVFALPTPDLLGISPQALAAYFRPVQWGTNVLAPVGLLPVSFMPPVPPDKSSHAEYNVK